MNELLKDTHNELKLYLEAVDMYNKNFDGSKQAIRDANLEKIKNGLVGLRKLLERLKTENEKPI